jgi:hypothetical protein
MRQCLRGHSPGESGMGKNETCNTTCFPLKTLAEFWRCLRQVKLRNEAGCHGKLSGTFGSPVRPRNQVLGCWGDKDEEESKAVTVTLDPCCMLESPRILNQYWYLTLTPLIFLFSWYEIWPEWLSLILSIKWGKSTPFLEKILTEIPVTFLCTVSWF